MKRIITLFVIIYIVEETPHGLAQYFPTLVSLQFILYDKLYQLDPIFTFIRDIHRLMDTKLYSTKIK